MKGMQKNKFRPQQPGQDSEPTGTEVQPMHILAGTMVFIVSVILMHFFGKITGGSPAAAAPEQ